MNVGAKVETGERYRAVDILQGGGGNMNADCRQPKLRCRTISDERHSACCYKVQSKSVLHTDEILQLDSGVEEPKKGRRGEK